MKFLKLVGVAAMVGVAAFAFNIGSSDAEAQTAATKGPTTSWTTYGSNLAIPRYSPADQITKDNFGKLEIA